MGLDSGVDPHELSGRLAIAPSPCGGVPAAEDDGGTLMDAEWLAYLLGVLSGLSVAVVIGLGRYLRQEVDRQQGEHRRSRG